jgi:cytosolic phospholipase A2
MPENAGFAPNRSETVEQQVYEETLAKRQKQKPFIVGPVPLHSIDLEAAAADDDNDENHNQARRPGFLLRKWKSFWDKVIKPAFPEAIQDIKIILGMAALKARVQREMTSVELHPEISSVAEVRRGLALCPEEQAFLERRRETTTRLGLARFLGVPPDDIHPDDVPIVAFGGSGGGFRAMIAYLGYVQAMKQCGLWDCVAYAAGVSGSCWALAAYYALTGCDADAAIDHCRRRFSPYHPLSSDAMRAILSTPGGANVTLGPVLQKRRAGLDTHAMDWYAVFTSGWIFFRGEAKPELGRSSRERDAAGSPQHLVWHKYSSLRAYTDAGAEPLPVMTAIRHERPSSDWARPDKPFDSPEHAGPRADHQEVANAWYQWFEMTPYEVGCDEVQGWAPTWGFGRPFRHGRSTAQLPEQALSLLLGFATSAPAASMASYLSTINRNLSYGFFGTSVREVARTFRWWWGKRGTEQFENHHPLHASETHNFLYHCTPLEDGQERPPGLESSPTIELIDSGMDNNCPTYVLLHPGRGVDVIINMDASSDVLNDTFQERVDQIGSRRGVKYTRRDTGSSVKSTETSATEDTVAAEPVKPSEKSVQPNGNESKDVPDDSLDAATAPDPSQPGNPYEGRYAQIYDGVPCERPAMVVDSYGRTVTNPPAPTFGRPSTMVYMPLLPNDAAVWDFNPSTAKFSGSYNLVWTPEQVDTLVTLSRANVAAGGEALKTALYEAWQRRKTAREKEASAGEEHVNGVSL